MSAKTDHIRRDAEHAARMEITLVLDQYKRRMYESAKAHIAGEITSLEGGTVDGLRLGREAASAGAGEWLGGSPQQAIDATAGAIEQ